MGYMSIKKNFAYNVVYQILNMLIPLITTPYISRVIGVEGVGVYAYTHSIAAYFILFAMLGLNNYGNRAIARARNDKYKLSETFWSIYTLQIITSGLSLCVYLVFILTTSYQYKSVLIVQLVLVISTLLDINWFYFGLEQFKLTVSRNIIIRIVSTCLIFIFVKTEKDLIIYAFILASGTFISQLTLWVFIKRFILFLKPKLNQVICHIKPNVILFIPVISVSIYRTMDKIMIGALSDMTQIGLYENADRIVTVPLGIITALGTVMLPKMSNMIALGEIERGEKYIRDSMQFALFLSIAMMFGLMAISERFAPIYFGSNFAKSGRLIGYLSPIVVFASWANVIRTQYLIPNGKDKSYIISVIFGAVINLIINFILIEEYGAHGAVIGTLAAEFIVMTYQTFAIRHDLNIITYIKDNFIFLVSGILMFTAVRVTGILTPNSIIGLLLQIITGIIVYPMMSLLLYKFIDKERFNYFRNILDISRIFKNRIKHIRAN